MKLAILALLLGSASAFLPSPAARRTAVVMKAQHHDAQIDRRSALTLGGAAWLSSVVPAHALGSVLGDLSAEDKAAAEAILSGETKARATKAPEPAAEEKERGGGGLLNLKLPDPRGEKKDKEPAAPKAPKEKKEKTKAVRGSAFDRVKVEKPKEEAVYADGEDPFEVARAKREEKRKAAEETFDRKKNNLSAMEQFKGRPISRD